MEFVLIIVAVVVVYAAFCVRIVQQQTVKVVETFGRFSRTLEPGLNFIFVPFQSIAGAVDLRIMEVRSEVNIKTKDNVFVELPVNIQLRVDAARVSEAFYKLADPHTQISTWVLNAIRSISSNMLLEDMFQDRTEIVSEVTSQLADKLSGYGYILEAVLIDQPTVSGAVQESFNRVVAAKRLAEAAEQEGKAEKIRLVAVAEAEAEAQRQRAKGLADARRTLAEGIVASMAKFEEQGVSAMEAINTLTEVNRIDALREVGKHGNTILVDLASKNLGVNVSAGKSQ
jgi:regulator of protease activity HflC (stomatin/prohibitin superfamily)